MLPRDHYLKQAFQDLIHFPNGFEKGGLSDIQARLIRKHGTLITALFIDEVSDATPEDLHILKVIANQSAPKSPVEQAWIKYLTIVKNLSSTGKGKSVKPKVAKAPPEAPAEQEIVETPAPVASSIKKAAKPEPSKSATVKAVKAEPEKKSAAPAKPEKKTTTKK